MLAAGRELESSNYKYKYYCGVGCGFGPVTQAMKASVPAASVTGAPRGPSWGRGSPSVRQPSIGAQCSLHKPEPEGTGSWTIRQHSTDLRELTVGCVTDWLAAATTCIAGQPRWRFKVTGHGDQLPWTGCQSLPVRSCHWQVDCPTSDSESTETVLPGPVPR